MERLHLFLTPKPHTPTHIPITNYTNQTTIGLKNYFTHVEFSQSISFFFFDFFYFQKKSGYIALVRIGLVSEDLISEIKVFSPSHFFL